MRKMKDRRNGKQRIRVGGDGGWRGERVDELGSEM